MFLAKSCVLSVALLCLVQLISLTGRTDGAPTLTTKQALAALILSRRFGYNNYYPRRYYGNYNNGYYNNYPYYYNNGYRNGGYNHNYNHGYNSGYKGNHKGYGK